MLLLPPLCWIWQMMEHQSQHKEEEAELQLSMAASSGILENLA